MAETKSEGLSKEEREAVKQRAKELREQEKAGKSREAGTKAVLEAISKLEGTDKAIAEGLHAVVTEVAPGLVPKTYYGMPGYANADGKIVVFTQPAGKFKVRYATVAFEQPAQLDDGVIWPVAWAVIDWNADIAKKIAAQVEKAVG